MNWKSKYLNYVYRVSVVTGSIVFVLSCDTSGKNKNQNSKDSTQQGQTGSGQADSTGVPTNPSYPQNNVAPIPVTGTTGGHPQTGTNPYPNNGTNPNNTNPNPNPTSQPNVGNSQACVATQTALTTAASRVGFNLSNVRSCTTPADCSHTPNTIVTCSARSCVLNCRIPINSNSLAIWNTYTNDSGYISAVQNLIGPQNTAQCGLAMPDCWYGPETPILCKNNMCTFF